MYFIWIKRMRGYSFILPRKSELEIKSRTDYPSIHPSTPIIQHSEGNGTLILMEHFILIFKLPIVEKSTCSKTFDRQCKINKIQQKKSGKQFCKICLSQWRHILVDLSNHIRSTLPDLLLWTSYTQLGWVSFSVFESTILSLWSKPPPQTQRNLHISTCYKTVHYKKFPIHLL